MGKKLYVGNLSDDTSDSKLQEMFQEFGKCSRHRSSWTVRLAAQKALASSRWAARKRAKAAINGLNGKEIGGRVLTVNEARPREDRGGGGGGRSGGARRLWRRRWRSVDMAAAKATKNCC